MRIFTRVILLGTIVLAVFMFSSPAAESPHIRMEKGAGQLIVNGQPFLILGGELGNSSAGTAEQADVLVPRLRSMHVNTILMPVTWEQIEPKEGSFDFDVLDHWVERAREHKMHLVLLWFGSWKNALSNYAPSWVKSDAKRFPRAEAADGRPHPYYLEVWRAAAPSIDFYSPDIYWPNFEYWVDRFEVARNPIFIPETQIEGALYHALYAYGQARAFGFSPFAIDSLKPPANDADPKPDIMQVYELLDSMRDLLPTAQAEGLTRGMVLHTTSLRPTRTIALGGYLFEATLSRSWPSRTIAADSGAMLILEASANEFYIAGSGLTVSFSRDPDVDAGIAGIGAVERVSRVSGQWITEEHFNGDQTNQGRQLLLDPHRCRIYRVRLYAIPR